MNIKKILDPFYIMSVFLHRIGTYLIPNDKTYIKLEYLFNFKRTLNIDHPIGFNEKLQWLKLHHKKEEFTKLVDKATVKEFIKNIIGEEYIIPTLGIWEKFDDINFESLPKQFVLKCTHDSGGVVICNNKNLFEKKKARKKITYCLKKNFYFEHREYPYKNVPPRIIAEKLLIDAENHDLRDYKFMCFSGACKMIFVCSNRSKHNVNVDFFDPQWNHLPFKRHYNNSPLPIQKPRNLEKMISLAEKISKNIDTPFVRIDFYEIKDKIYFGEITFFPGAGLEEFTPQKWDDIIGSWIDLSKLKNE